MESLQHRLASATLGETLADVTRQIQANPANADLRAAFVQLLCLSGNWARAQTQLQSWLALSPQAQPTVNLLQQAIAGELQRDAMLRGEADPVLPGSAWHWCDTLLAASDERFLRASVTEWQPLGDDPDQFIGQGQKMWLSDSAEFSLLSLQQLAFDNVESADES